MDEVIWNWRKLWNEQVLNLLSLPRRYVVRMIKSRKMKQSSNNWIKTEVTKCQKYEVSMQAPAVVRLPTRSLSRDWLLLRQTLVWASDCRPVTQLNRSRHLFQENELRGTSTTRPEFYPVTFNYLTGYWLHCNYTGHCSRCVSPLKHSGICINFLL